MLPDVIVWVRDTGKNEFYGPFSYSYVDGKRAGEKRRIDPQETALKWIGEKEYKNFAITTLKSPG